MKALATEPRMAPSASLAAAHVAACNIATSAFFTSCADEVSSACHAMSQRFQSGGRLLVAASPSRQSDVAHAVVEFVHPVIVGKRALPALLIANAAALEVLGQNRDIFMYLGDREPGADALAMFAGASRRGMLTLLLCAESPGWTVCPCDFRFAVPSTDPFVVQEVHEMLYHILWELVHVFFGHQAGRT